MTESELTIIEILTSPSPLVGEGRDEGWTPSTLDGSMASPLPVAASDGIVPEYRPSRPEFRRPLTRSLCSRPSPTRGEGTPHSPSPSRGEGWGEGEKGAYYVKASDLDKSARDHIISKGFPSIPHSLGHGIGLEVHESPSLSPNSKDKLAEGMVFSIEPGIYVNDKMGVRIEDLFTIQNNKLIQLTNAPKELIQI